MRIITPSAVLAQLPSAALNARLHACLESVKADRPDGRRAAVAERMLRGMLSRASPRVTPIARGADQAEQTIGAPGQRLYR